MDAKQWGFLAGVQFLKECLVILSFQIRWFFGPDGLRVVDVFAIESDRDGEETTVFAE